MDLREALLTRRSIREFNDQPVSDGIVRELLQGAMAAPSAHNKQPWEFYVVRSRPLREQLRHVSRYSSMNSSLIIMVAGNQQRFMAPPASEFWVQDCSAAVENLLLCAASLGVASCWCGLYPSAEPVRKVRAILGLEDHIIPMALIHLGFSDVAAAPRTQYDESRVHLVGEPGETPQ